MNHILEVKNLKMDYQGERILDGINFHADNAEFIAILGPSGCGKSTILNLLSGLEAAEEGEIFFGGQCLHGVSGHFAYMPQNDLLFPWYTILENVMLFGRVHHLDLRERALREFPAFGLSGYEDAFPGQLSGGMRQRAAFLRTVLCDADILLLDEPFAALDVITRNDMQDWLLRLRRSLKQTILFVTHDIDEALYLADRLLILSHKPTRVLEEINLHGIEKSRGWLFSQAELREKIYNELRDRDDA